MYDVDFRLRLLLNRQYFRETGERFSFFDEEKNRQFLRFYENRRKIGREIFNELKRRGYDLTSSRTLEMFANIYDSIGISYHTGVIDNDISLLREQYSDHRIDHCSRYHVYILFGRIFITGEEFGPITSVSTKFGRMVRRTNRHVNLDQFDDFVLLNPRNHHEERIMRELLTTHHNVFVGYFGSCDDQDMERHEEHISRLHDEMGTELISDLSISNSYAYILRKSRI